MPKLGIQISVEDEGLTQLIESIKSLVSLAGGSLPQTFEAAQKRVRDSVKTTSDQIENTRKESAQKEEDRTKQLESIQERANAAQAASVARYAQLKTDYERKSLDAVRDAIMKGEESARTLRRARADETDKDVKKELQARTNQVQTELQLFRSLEKEKIGRTFAEQMERLKLDEKSNAEIKKLLKQQEEDFAKIQHQMTVTQNDEEKKRLKADLETLKAETAAAKQEAEHRKIDMSGGGHEGGNIMKSMFMAGAGGASFNALTEGFKKVKEAAEETAHSESALRAATGKSFEESKKEAEELGNTYAVGGEKAASVMALVANKTGLQGEELKKATEATIAYAEANNIHDPEKLAKKLETQTGRTKILADAQRNQAIAQQMANDPAKQAELIQAKLSETVGKVAMVVMEALGPALKALQPVMDAVGNLLGTTLKPVLEKISPVIEKVADLFAALAPVVSDLINGALTALSPILDVLTESFSTLIDPITKVVKSIGATLSPILAQMAPLIKAVATIILDELTGNLQILLPVLGELLPPLIELLAPILKLLITIITPLAQLLAGALNGAIQLVTNALLFIVDKAIKPAVEWFGGKLQKAIDATVGAITKAVGAISNIVSSVGSFLGLGDKAANAATDATKKAGEAAQKQAAQDALIAKANDEKRSKMALADKLKLGKISAQEEQQLREQAQDEGDDMMLKKLDDFDKKKEAKAAAAAKHGAKAQADAAKSAADEILAEKKEEIAAMDLTDRQAKAKIKDAEVQHAEDLLNVARRFYGEKSKQFQSAQRQLQALQIANHKQDIDDLIKDIKAQEARELGALDAKADAEGMALADVEKQKKDIQVKSIDDQLKIVKKGSDEEAKLQEERASIILNYDRNLAKERKAITVEERKIEMDNLKESGKLKIELLKAQGKDTTDAEIDSMRLQEQELRDALAKEIEDRKKSGAYSAKLESDLREQERLKEQNLENAFAAEKIKQAKETAAQLTDIAMAGNNDRLKLASQFAEKQLGIQGLSMLQQQGGLKQFLTQNLAMLVQNQAAQILTTQLSEVKKTALVAAGVAARGAELVGEGIASAASAAGTWLATAAKAVFNAFESMPFPLDIVAAAAAVAGVYELSTMVAGMFKPKKMAEGGVTTASTIVNTSEFGQHEAIVPLNKYQGMNDLMGGGIAQGIKELNVSMKNVHSAIMSQPQTAVLPPYSSKIWQSQGSKIVNQRKLGT